MVFNPSAKKIAAGIQRNRAKTRPRYSQNPDKRLGTVSAVTVGGKVSVILDGESDAASYACAGIYYPIVGDRVILEKIGNTWVVMTSVSVTLKPKFQSGTGNINVTASSGGTTAVVFPIAFDSAPRVFANLTSSAGPTAGVVTRAISVTNTGFTAFATGSSTQTYSTAFYWVAIDSTAAFT